MWEDHGGEVPGVSVLLARGIDQVSDRVEDLRQGRKTKNDLAIELIREGIRLRVSVRGGHGG